jgi:hypothetical protein
MAAALPPDPLWDVIELFLPTPPRRTERANGRERHSLADAPQNSGAGAARVDAAGPLARPRFDQEPYGGRALSRTVVSHPLTFYIYTCRVSWYAAR